MRGARAKVEEGREDHSREEFRLPGGSSQIWGGLLARGGTNEATDRRHRLTTAGLKPLHRGISERATTSMSIFGGTIYLDGL
jgi:hypothetical protein